MAYVKRDYDAVPVLRMMRLSTEEITRRAEAMVAQIKSEQAKPAKLKMELCDGESVIGGGAAPSAVLPTRLIALSHAELSADELCARLRASDPPVIARVEEGRVLIDLRTVPAPVYLSMIAAVGRTGREDAAPMLTAVCHRVHFSAPIRTWRFRAAAKAALRALRRHAAAVPRKTPPVDGQEAQPASSAGERRR